MMNRFKKLRIAGIAAAVPERVQEVRSLASLPGIKGTSGIERVVKNTGIARMRVTDVSVTASDLCCEAARSLLESHSVKPDEIDALIFVTTGPDYLTPPTSYILHQRLGLRMDVPCFDLAQGCNGYIYGLLQSGMLTELGLASKILLLVGETPTKDLDPKDASTRVLFGDAGTATLVTADGTRESFLSVYSDGSGHRDIRFPNSATRKSEEPRFLTMNGIEVFNFAINRVPDCVNEILKVSGLVPAGLETFVFHQANQMIVDHLIKTLGFPEERSLSSLENFGNPGAGSIPLTLALSGDRFTGKIPERPSLLCGFGVGLSWGAAVADLSSTRTTPLRVVGPNGKE